MIGQNIAKWAGAFPRRKAAIGAVVSAMALLLAACQTYPLGMSKAEWLRLTPEQQHEARMKQGEINKNRSQRRAHAAAARRAQAEAENRRIQAMYESDRWGDVVECVVEGGMADFHPGWRRYKPTAFTLARGESKRITLRENGRKTGRFFASYSGNGTDLRICYRDPRHGGRQCANVPVSRRGFSHGYARRITVRNVFRNAQLYCAYRPGEGMPRVRVYRENAHIWDSIYRYHYPGAPRPSRVIYYDRRYHGHRARERYKRRPHTRRNDYRPRYDRRDDRRRHDKVRERDRRDRDDRYTRRPHDRRADRRDDRRDDKDRARRDPGSSAGAAAAAYIDRKRRRDRDRRDDVGGRDRDKDRVRRDDRRDDRRARRDDRDRRADRRDNRRDARRDRRDDVRVGNVRVRESNKRRPPPRKARKGPAKDLKAALRKGPPKPPTPGKPKDAVKKVAKAVKKGPPKPSDLKKGKPKDKLKKLLKPF